MRVAKHILNVVSIVRYWTNLFETGTIVHDYWSWNFKFKVISNNDKETIVFLSEIHFFVDTICGGQSKFGISWRGKELSFKEAILGKNLPKLIN